MVQPLNADSPILTNEVNSEKSTLRLEQPLKALTSNLFVVPAFVEPSVTEILDGEDVVIHSESSEVFTELLMLGHRRWYTRNRHR